MPISYKFIAVQNNPNSKTELNHSKDLIDNKINYENVKKFFMELGKYLDINEDDMMNTKFIINNSMNMSLNEDTDFEIDVNEKKVIFVFTVEKDTRSKLLQLFNDNGYYSQKIEDKSKKSEQIAKQSKETVSEKSKDPDPNICKPIPEDEIKITNDIIEDSNKKTIQLFDNENFKTLLKIYKDDPDVFKLFSSYVCNGDVIIDSFEEKSKVDYEFEFETIKSLNLQLDDNKIKESLQRNNGHLNLSLRWLLYNSVSNNTEKVEEIE